MNFLNHSKRYYQYLLAILAVHLFSSGEGLFAQQDAQYTQYMYNMPSINPSYAGSKESLSVTALYRSQWAGLEGAPKTQTLSLHSPIGYRGVGLGFGILNEQIGPTSETYFDLDFSYTIFTSREGRLSFGLKGSAHLLDIQYSKLNQDFSNPNGPDPLLQQDIENKFSPNIGAGVYYHNGKFYVGASVPRILETTHFKSSNISTAKERMNLYFTTGYVFEMNRDLKFKPTLLTKVVRGAPLQIDLSANFMFNEKFIVGAAYRWSAAVSGMLGFYVDDGFLLGLAYDKETTDLGGTSFNAGSFEVLLRYDFKKGKRGRIQSPRFF
ncbi:type IX secretion system membrane protein, PorP/SprF family [Pricia antarctica]|uniref:Type IX secretion system membrane protein, PorP/SprF family n=1 Tax=Pricia antarctica TaxID=641691 RepID=A0A1G7GCR6_9FLAO|nr:type IX secretion system membrane protein PorP/SprF [Pricia antarctica]SDE85789.1 type IX secretion system membrane protein, PorP/SprF family [Pricia antarctica]